MTTTVQAAKYDPALALQELTSWLDAPDDGAWVTTGHRVEQALLLSLEAAEVLAHAVGVAPVHYRVGDSVVLDWSKAPAGARDLYMGTQHWAEAIGRTVTPDAGPVPTHDLGAGAPSMGQVVVVALAVIGIAAIISTAWYAADTTAVRIHAHQAQQLAKTTAAVHIATAAVTAGKPIPPALLKDLQLDTSKPVSVRWGWGALAVGGLLAVGIAVGSAIHARA